MTKAPQENVVHRVLIRLADNEWGSQLMGEVARAYFDAHPDLDPLEVEVIEHAGWRLTFIRDGAVVGTANDMAILAEDARKFIERTRRLERRHVESIRRPEAACKRCGADRDIVGGGLCGRCRLAEYSRSTRA